MTTTLPFGNSVRSWTYDRERFGFLAPSTAASIRRAGWNCKGNDRTYWRWAGVANSKNRSRMPNVALVSPADRSTASIPV